MQPLRRICGIDPSQLCIQEGVDLVQLSFTNMSAAGVHELHMDEVTSRIKNASELMIENSKVRLSDACVVAHCCHASVGAQR